jgi:hypothetical protein
VCERCGFEEVGFDEMFIMQSAEIFGDGGNSGIACPDNHIRHAFFGFITTCQMTWGRLLCYDFHTIDALGMGSVCHIYTIVHYLQGAARCSHYFSCAKSVQGESNGKTSFDIAEP